MMAESESTNLDLLELEDRIHQLLTSELEKDMDLKGGDGIPDIDMLKRHKLHVLKSSKNLETVVYYRYG